MPTKKTITEIVEGPEDEQEIIVTADDLEEEAEETALDGLLAEFQGADNVSVNVYRQGDGKNMSFLFKTMPEDMTGGDIMERCRDKFGSGDYRLHVRQGRRIVSNRPFSVEAPKEPIVEVQQNSNADIIALIQAQNAQMSQLFMGTMQAMAEAFKGSQSQQQPVNPIEMQNSVLQGVAMMQKLAGGDKKEPGGVEMLIKGIELAKEIAPKTGETNTLDILSKGLDMFPMLAKAGEANKIMMQGHQNPPVGMPGHEPVHALKGPPTSASNPTPEQTPISPDEEQQRKESEMFMRQAKANLQYLCKLAQQNKDPELYAEVVLDQMGEEKVLEFIGKPDALDTLGQIEPGVLIYKGWFISLRSAILQLTSDQEPEPEEVISEDDNGNPDPQTVIARIDQSGLRREGRKGATITIPEAGNPDPDGSDSQPTGDTPRS